MLTAVQTFVRSTLSVAVIDSSISLVGVDEKATDAVPDELVVPAAVAAPFDA